MGEIAFSGAGDTEFSPAGGHLFKDQYAPFISGTPAGTEESCRASADDYCGVPGIGVWDFSAGIVWFV